MRASQGRKAGDDREEGSIVGMLRRRGGGGGVTEREVLASQATWEGVSLRRQHHPILWNHLQKLTDLSANLGVHQTVPETSVQLCTPGWSRVPGEKMLSGKIPGSMLGEQRQTHNRESQRGWMRGNPLLPRLCGHMSCQSESSMWPSNSCSHHASL